MKSLSLAIAAFLMFGAAPLAAQGNPVVVELYTSQGCSSCPAADALLLDLARREDVIALALHVDYWDYIGWKDQFGNPAHADRQRAYAHAGGRRSVYTPEMIVNGVTDIVGAQPMELAEAIAAHKSDPERVDLTVSRAGETLTISAKAAQGVAGPMVLHMLRYTPIRTTEITRGENAGRTLDYANVVEGWQVLGKWDGAAPLSMTAKAPGDKPAVVLVQSGAAGPILAAAQVK